MDSAWRLIGAVLAERHEEWSTGRKYLDMAEFRTWKKQASGLESEPDESRERQPVLPNRTSRSALLHKNRELIPVHFSASGSRAILTRHGHLCLGSEHHRGSTGRTGEIGTDSLRRSTDSQIRRTRVSSSEHGSVGKSPWHARHVTTGSAIKRYCGREPRQKGCQGSPVDGRPPHGARIFETHLKIGA